MGIVYSLSTHSCSKHGWKIPCISMAWRLLMDLGEYMCMTHTLNISYMEENGHSKVKDGHLALLACLPHSPQSGLRFGRRNIQSMSVYLAIYIFQNQLKKVMEKLCGIRWKHCLLVKVGYYPLLSLAALAFNFIHCLFLSIVNYFIVYWVHQCSIIWPIES